MPNEEHVVKITLAEIYKVLVDTKGALDKLLTEVEYGNHEARISALEQDKWKIAGVAAAIAGVITMAIGFFQ